MFKIIETTTDDIKIAELISQAIINNKLSPCVQITNTIKSNYIWEDGIESIEEYMIKIKTVERHIYKISSVIKNKSNYDIPEIISYSFNIENDEYKDWFVDNV